MRIRESLEEAQCGRESKNPTLNRFKPYQLNVRVYIIFFFVNKNV